MQTEIKQICIKNPKATVDWSQCSYHTLHIMPVIYVAYYLPIFSDGIEREQTYEYKAESRSR